MRSPEPKPNSCAAHVVFINWEEAFGTDLEFVGGKAWNLARLQRFGFNVPEGGVLPTSVYCRFIQENSIHTLLDHARDSITLQNIDSEGSKSQLDTIRNAILSGHFSATSLDQLVTALQGLQLLDKPLAIRSSASAEDSTKASFAGMHESFLNIRGREQIVQAIKRCYASLWSQRAVAYRRKMDIDDREVLAAVVIMQLIDADAAGVAFSCDPVSGREDICFVNANFGLGESVVDGSIEPDTYIIHRYSCTTIKKHLGSKQKTTRLNPLGGTATQDADHVHAQQTVRSTPAWALDETRQKDLGLLISRVFSALSAADVHQDIEWALKDNVFYLLQARPVTVIPRYTANILADQSDIWSNSNFRDALPMVVPVLQRDTNEYTINRTIMAMFRRFDAAVPPGLGICKLIQGRLYFNTALYQRLIYDAVGMLPADFNLFSGGHQPDIQVPAGSPFKGLAGLRRILRLVSYARAISKTQKQQQRLYAKIDTFVDRFEHTRLTELSSQQLLDLLLATERCLNEFMDSYMLLSSGIGPFGIAIKKLRPVFGNEAAGIVSALATGQGNQPSANQVYGLLELAEIARDDPNANALLSHGDFSNAGWQQLPARSPFRQAFARYLDEYGFRAVFEADVSQPRWREDPSYLLNNIAANMANASVKQHRQHQRQLRESAKQRLKKAAGWFTRQWVSALIKDAVRGADTRETAKFYSIKTAAVTRYIYLEAARRLHEQDIIDAPGDIFYCARPDVIAILSGQWRGDGLKVLLAERKRQMQSLINQDAPDVVIDSKKHFQTAIPLNGDNAYQGIGVSAGQVQGKARCITDPAQGESLKPGDIMIAPSTDPSWTPLFLNAAGIVLETGGYTSHGSIVAREYGIPAVVNVPGALRLITAGQTVVVNGDDGTVSVS